MAKKRTPPAKLSPLAEKEFKQYLQSIRTFKPPPAGFDPRKAGKRELAIYGFPRRPDPKTEKHLHALWRKIVSRPMKTVQAKLAIDRVLLNRKSQLGKMAKGKKFSPSGWGGIVTQVSDFNFKPAEPVNMVYGEWFIPSVEPDYNNPNNAMTVGFWVGIDGFTNGQVLQAGMAATVTGNNINYWPWFEWYPNPPLQITNFPIQPGDYITVLVCATIWPGPCSHVERNHRCRYLGSHSSTNRGYIRGRYRRVDRRGNFGRPSELRARRIQKLLGRSGR